MGQMLNISMYSYISHILVYKFVCRFLCIQLIHSWFARRPRCELSINIREHVLTRPRHCLCNVNNIGTGISRALTSWSILRCDCVRVLPIVGCSLPLVCWLFCVPIYHFIGIFFSLSPIFTALPLHLLLFRCRCATCSSLSPLTHTY